MEGKNEKTQIEKEQGGKHVDIDHYEKIIERADKEIERVHKSYHKLAWLLGLLILGGGAYTYKSMEGLKGEVRNIRSDMRQEAKDIKENFSKEMDILSREIRSRIEEEFDKENIHKLVQETARERIDVAVDLFTNQHMTPFVNKVNRQLADSNERIFALEKKIQEIFTNSENKLKELQTQTEKRLAKNEAESELLITVLRSKSDDRKAFEQLKRWSTDASFQFSDQALGAYNMITSEYKSGPYYTHWPISSWYDSGDPSKLTLDELTQYYKEQPNLSFRKLAIIDYIWYREDFPKRKRMEFLAGVIQNDQNLEAVAYAGHFFERETDLKLLHPLEINKMLGWWEKNKDKIK